MAVTMDYRNAMRYFSYCPDTGFIYNKSSGKHVGSNNKGYIQFRSAKVRFQAHRFAHYYMTGALPACIDHINGIKDDNRWCNLRGCTVSQNSANRKLNSDNKSGYRGVYKGYKDSYCGLVIYKGIRYYKSGFNTPQLANQWVVNKSKEVYGEFYNEDRAKEAIR